eukprot:TRINITY_DN11295_c0_g2_i1.p1 TRINITY_DN11295_c0_g2~~TRINITY_DN11295_c0_g2_i1.p1  ORF type:complete len:142 (+),score=35.74 TRINITY_DN11295_c0_g2_i1:17-442(+)
MSSSAAAITGQTTFLEQFLESLRILPADVHRQLQLLKVMDTKYASLTESLRTSRAHLLQVCTSRGVPPELEDLKRIRQMEDELYSLSCEKVEIARELQGVVQTYLSRLEADMSIFKAFFPVEENEDGENQTGSNHGSGYFE